MTLTMLLIFIVILTGLYFYAINSDSKYAEGYTNQKSQPRCPNLLIQKDSKFHLYNSKLVEVPGVNPIEFNSLEEYTEFLDWQRSQGIRCPVLYLQSTYDAQGNQVYKVRPSVTELQAGLPPSNASPIGIASQDPPIMESSLGYPNALAYPNPTLLVDATRNDPPYNKGSYPAYDETSYYVGTTTPLDMMDVAQEKAPISPNPMDPNWGGPEYTQSLVDRGYYKENEVKIRV
jgi:hypothetical protein